MAQSHSMEYNRQYLESWYYTMSNYLESSTREAHTGEKSIGLVKCYDFDVDR